MRHAKATLLIVLAVLLFSPTRAFAQWDIIKWIQELSGPGPFEVDYGLDVSVACKPRDTPRSEVTIPAEIPKNPDEYGWFFCDKRPHTWRNVQRFYGFVLGKGDGNNNLVFPDGVPKNDKVGFSYFAFKGAWRAHDMIDVGSLAGVHRFAGTPSVIVSRFVIDPYFSIRPLGLVGLHDKAAPRWKDILARSIEVNFGVTFYPEGFTAGDFGALRTTNDTVLSGGAEAIAHWGVKFLVVY